VPARSTPILKKCVAFLRGLQENERKGTGENNEKPYYSRLDPTFLPDPIQTAVSDGTLPVSQGYLFAANLDCPDCDKIFETIMKTPVTYVALERLLTAWKQPKPEPTDPKPVTVAKQVTTIKAWKTAIQQNIGAYKKADLQTLLDQLKEFVLFVQQKMKPAV
jgi:hypothetical protein